MSRSVFATAAKLMLQQISIYGPHRLGHSRFTRYPGVLCHLAVHLCTEPERPRYMAEGSPQTAPDGAGAQTIDRPQRLNNWQQALRQTTNYERLRHPPQITAFIKQQQETATRLARGPHPAAGLTSFCASMDGLLSRPGLSMNYIHYSAIITAAMHVWAELPQSPSFRGRAEVSKRLKPLLQRCVQSLQVWLADMGARQISNVLWSSATLSFNPDDAVPGMVHALTVRFVQSLHVTEGKQQPNTRDVANMLWALVAMGHPAATTQMVDSVCLHFARLTQHTDAQQRPTAQECANALRSLATLGHSSAAGAEMMDSVCLHVACLVGSCVAQQRPKAQEVANLVWALGKLKHTPPDRLLDQLCGYMRDLLCSYDQRTRPYAQAVAITMWALAQLKHVPAHDTVTALFHHLVDMCRTPGLQPDSQNISNCFIACAELRLDVKPTCVEALLKLFMAMHVSDVRCQHYSNLAWSLAVMQSLDLNIFEALLDKLTTKLSGESGHQSSFAQLHIAESTQLHQAMVWLRPHSDFRQMSLVQLAIQASDSSTRVGSQRDFLTRAKNDVGCSCNARSAVQSSGAAGGISSRRPAVST